MIREGRSLEWLGTVPRTAEELEYEHRLDISGSVYARMCELGLSQGQLAHAMGVDKAQVSRIIRGKQNLTLRTIARLEQALGFRLDEGFAYEPDGTASESGSYRWSASQSEAGERPEEVGPAKTVVVTDLVGQAGTFSVWDGGEAA